MGRHDNLRRYAPATTSYCRVSNIYFNRPVTVPPPAIDLPSLLDYQRKLSSTSIIECHRRSISASNQRPIDCVSNQRHDDNNDNSSNKDSLESISEPCLTKQTIKSLLNHSHQQYHTAYLSLDMRTQHQSTGNNHIKKSCTDSDYRSNSVDSAQSSSSDLTHTDYSGVNSKHATYNNYIRLCDSYSPQSFVKSATNGTINNINQSKQPIVDVDYAREKLIAKVNKHLFWSSKAAKNVHIYSIEQKLVYIYTLESFTEKRSIEWQYEPHNNKWSRSALSKIADGQREPSRERIWSDLIGNLKVPAESLDDTGKPLMRMFQSSISTKELPYTSFVKTCHICMGRARKSCGNCNALGYEVCYACLGKGQGTKRSHSSYQWSSNDQRSASRSLSRSSQDLRYASSNRMPSFEFTSSETCHHCHGGGKRRCLKCKGTGFIICQGCRGQAKVRCYMKLSIVLNNHKKESIINNDNETIIPDDRLKLASGCKIFEQTAPKVVSSQYPSHYDDSK